MNFKFTNFIIRNIQYYYLKIDVMATKLMLTGIGLFLMASARSSIRLKAKLKSQSSQRRTITHIWKDKTNIIQMKG
ncbi:hypothetical protein T05_3395 [Trichinella murrelli]|uniref:Uncharacterized protein n=1 Tax=Trichinella murrelli TaxID=144512 RepID=A0A0V0U8X4_9BILA|nr:hypothetical protein T05_3395 [Trichinella murrelli]